MDATPVTFSSRPVTLPGKPPPRQPRFSGWSESAAALVGFIDSNRNYELLASDGFGMDFPRSLMAYAKRGPDDGRETFLRETSGLIGNVLLAGWLGYGTLKVAGDRINVFNPKGLADSAWISATNLDSFSKLYQKALANPTNQTVSQVRSQFVKDVLKGLESHNSQFIQPAQLQSLKALPENQQLSLLRQMMEKNLGEVKTRQYEETYQHLPVSERIQKLTAEFKQASGIGKLAEEAQNEIAGYFRPRKEIENATPHEGTLSLDEKARQEIDYALSQKHSDYALKLQKDPVFQEKEFLKARMRHFKDSRHSTERFVDFVDKKALNKGLTGTVNLKDGQKMLSASESRKTLLTQLKFFLEHYVDRAAHETQGITTYPERVQAMESKLFKPAGSGFLHQLLPKSQDGLVNAAIKAKNVYTWVPLALSIGAAGAFTFYNNYITMKKHNGKIFFPGEASVPLGAAGNAQKPPIAPHRQTLPLNRNFKPLMGFQQARSPNGGILA